MFSFAIVIFSLMCAVIAAPTKAPEKDTTQKPQIEIVTLISDISPDGSFSYSFEGSDGTKARQEGKLKYIDEKHAGTVMKGSYEYIGNDGKLYSVSYYADETGFHAEGDHIPKIPEVIAKSLEWAKEHPYTEENSVESS